MKNIALLASDFSIEHCQDFIKGALEYFDAFSDVNVFVIQTQYSHDSGAIFDYQYWAGVEILKSKQIDAYILISSVYCSIWNKEKLKKIISEFGGRPVISAAIDLELENSYAVLNNCRKSFDDIIRHLKEEHNCKRIAFLGANSTHSPEALERFDSFKEALKNNGLKFYEDLLFDGAFVSETAEEDILNKIKSKEDLNFDALVSASDLMLVGAKRAFTKIGISIPQDIKAIGFDDAVFASLSSPKFSTINQNISGQGAKCAEIALKVLNGEKVDHIIRSDLYPMYRQSCGCISMTNSELIYKDSKGNLCKEETIKGNLLELYMNEILEKHKYASLLDLVKVANTLKQLYFNLGYFVDVAMLSDIAICLYDEPIFLNKHELPNIPKKAEMIMYSSSRQKGIKAFRPEVIFDWSERICPIDSIRKEEGAYILYPIFSGEANYGYFLCKPRKKNFGAYTVNLKILISVFSTAVEYTNNILQREKLSSENHQLTETNTNLYMQSKTDELTKLLNRRGFMEIGQRTIDIAQEMNNSCIVFFADLDGLKTINDTYGHEMGDKAIKLQAEILKKAFRSSDVIGRLSGDEFGIIASSMNIEHVDTVRKKVEAMNKEISVKNNLPFTLSISFGAVELTSSSVLTKLLTEADKVLYEEKRRKHAKRDKKKTPNI
ncbi:MAG: GGDEF domain-containing protein [Treponema sp.]|nr:GGDEF domain-containing protein [Treponema sp.]